MAGLAAIALLAGSGRAADHLDSPTLTGNPMADITDVYAWMTGSNLNLIMDVSPADDGTRAFGPAVLYVFHVTSRKELIAGSTAGTETRVMCQFDSSTSAQCWVVTGTTTKDYVTGDPSNTAGVTSILGKVKVFAGRRSDPFFFSRTGFTTGVNIYPGLAISTIDGGGCPSGITPGQAASIRNPLLSGSDDFAASSVMAIVVQVDKSLVNAAGNAIVAVWGSTHAGT